MEAVADSATTITTTTTIVLIELCQQLRAVDGRTKSTVSRHCYNSLSLADDVLRPRDDLMASTQTYDVDSNVEINVVDDGQFSAAMSLE